MWEFRLARLVVTVTVTGLPGETVPDVCDKLTEPRRLDGSETDQDTGAPCAVMVKEPPSRGESTIEAGDTVIVPVTGGDVAAGGPELLADPDVPPPVAGADDCVDGGDAAAAPDGPPDGADTARDARVAAPFGVAAWDSGGVEGDDAGA